MGSKCSDQDGVGRRESVSAQLSFADRAELSGKPYILPSFLLPLLFTGSHTCYLTNTRSPNLSRNSSWTPRRLHLLLLLAPLSRQRMLAKKTRHEGDPRARMDL